MNTVDDPTHPLEPRADHGRCRRAKRVIEAFGGPRIPRPWRIVLLAGASSGEFRLGEGRQASSEWSKKNGGTGRVSEWRTMFKDVQRISSIIGGIASFDESPLSGMVAMWFIEVEVSR